MEPYTCVISLPVFVNHYQVASEKPGVLKGCNPVVPSSPKVHTWKARNKDFGKHKPT